MKKIVAGLLIVFAGINLFSACESSPEAVKQEATKDTAGISFIAIDTSDIPHSKFGDAVRYGRELMMNTAYYIGPDGTKGKYLGNKMNCTNCHQDGGTKPFSFNLMASHDNYPQYRAREGKILSLAERVNNCVMRPHNGRPLPLDGTEMIAFLSYFKWINSYVVKGKPFTGEKNYEISFPDTPADPDSGKVLYAANCARCHGESGEGKWNADQTAYVYPPLWGEQAYQPGSSMHRVIKQAQWLKGNMPFDKVAVGKPFLTDQEALHIAAFVNEDELHKRPNPANFDYPHPEEKALDYDHPPFADTFSVAQHKYGPFGPMIDYWKSKGKKAVY